MKIVDKLKAWGRSPERVAFGVLLLLFVWQALFTLWDYGITWDCWEYYVGDKTLRFYLTLDPGSLDFRRDDIRLYDEPGHPDFHAVTTAQPDNDVMQRPYLVWPLGPVSSSITKRLFWRWLGPVAAHHLVLVGWGLALFGGLYAFVRRYWGPWAAVAAVLLTLLHPRFFAHLHNNVKDIPSTVLFCLTLLAFAHGLLSRSPRWLWWSAVGWGLALAAKPNALFLPVILGPWFLYVLWRRQREADGPVLPRDHWPALLAYPLLGFGTMLAAWPYLLMDWPRAMVAYIRSLTERGYAGPANWNAMPVVHVLTTTPLPMLLLLLGGLGAIAARTVAKRRLAPLDLLLLLWLTIPVLRVSVPGARDFDGIRHWLEFVPAAAVAAGLAVQAAADRLPERRRAWAVPLLLLLWMSPTIVWDIRNHPNQLCFFNRLVGGLAGARAHGIPEATDYWGQSYLQGYEWLNEHAPPDSKLYLGVAEHLGWYTREIWLRKDIELLPLTGVDANVIGEQIARNRDRIFLMYIVRPALCDPLCEVAEARLTPVHAVTVDGAPILRIVPLADLAD